MEKAICKAIWFNFPNPISCPIKNIYNGYIFTADTYDKCFDKCKTIDIAFNRETWKVLTLYDFKDKAILGYIENSLFIINNNK